jgi:hypothetical protein
MTHGERERERKDATNSENKIEIRFPNTQNITESESCSSQNEPIRVAIDMIKGLESGGIETIKTAEHKKQT